MSKRKQTKRREMLYEAADLVDGDRENQYGNPNSDFGRTAQYWSIHAGAVLRRKLREVLEEKKNPSYEDVIQMVDRLFDNHDVAIMMTQLKISRLSWSPEKRDNWVDGAGYMACGWDCVESAG